MVTKRKKMLASE